MVSNVTDEEMQEHYDNFFEDVFVECEDKVNNVILCFCKSFLIFKEFSLKNCMF